MRTPSPRALPWGKEVSGRNEKGHYDKPLNRIGLEISFGWQGKSEEVKPEPAWETAAESERKEKKCPLIPKMIVPGLA